MSADAFEEVFGGGFGAGPDAFGHDLEAWGGSAVFGESGAGAEQEAFFGFLLVVPRAHLGTDDFVVMCLRVEFFPVGEWLGAAAGSKHVG